MLPFTSQCKVTIDFNTKKAKIFATKFARKIISEAKIGFFLYRYFFGKPVDDSF